MQKATHVEKYQFLNSLSSQIQVNTCCFLAQCENCRHFLKVKYESWRNLFVFQILREINFWPFRVAKLKFVTFDFGKSHPSKIMLHCLKQSQRLVLRPKNFKNCFHVKSGRQKNLTKTIQLCFLTSIYLLFANCCYHF